VRCFFWHHYTVSQHRWLLARTAEIQGIWPFGGCGLSRLFSGDPDIFAGLLPAFAKTTLGKGPHMPLTEIWLRALKTKDKPNKVADQRGRTPRSLAAVSCES